MSERVYSGKGDRELFLPSHMDCVEETGNFETLLEQSTMLLDTSPSQCEGSA